MGRAGLHAAALEEVVELLVGRVHAGGDGAARLDPQHAGDDALDLSGD